MNEPQVWTLIGVFAASTFAMMGLMSTVFVNVINSKFERVDEQFARVDATMNARLEGLHGEMGGLRGEMNPWFEGLRGEMVGLRGEMNAGFGGLRGEMIAGFARVDSKIDHLDKDVQTLFRRVFPDAG